MKKIFTLLLIASFCIGTYAKTGTGYFEQLISKGYVQNYTKDYKKINDYDSVVRNYTANETKEMAKEKNLQYITDIIKPTFDVTFLNDKSADDLTVKYNKMDEGGISTTMIVNYKFQKKDFVITIKSIEYAKNSDSIIRSITKNSTVEAEKKFYEVLKRYFIDGHADYIAPE